MITWKQVITEGGIKSFNVAEVRSLDPHESYKGQSVLSYIKKYQPRLWRELLVLEPFQSAIEESMKAKNAAAAANAPKIKTFSDFLSCDDPHQFLLKELPKSEFDKSKRKALKEILRQIKEQNRYLPDHYIAAINAGMNPAQKPGGRTGRMSDILKDYLKGMTIEQLPEEEKKQIRKLFVYVIITQELADAKGNLLAELKLLLTTAGGCESGTEVKKSIISLVANTINAMYKGEMLQEFLQGSIQERFQKFTVKGNDRIVDLQKYLLEQYYPGVVRVAILALDGDILASPGRESPQPLTFAELSSLDRAASPSQPPSLKLAAAGPFLKPPAGKAAAKAGARSDNDLVHGPALVGSEAGAGNYATLKSSGF